MTKTGDNKFNWGRDDYLKTFEEDILCTIDQPVPVSNRAVGLAEEDLKRVKKLFDKATQGYFFISIFHLTVFYLSKPLVIYNNFMYKKIQGV